MAKQTQRHVRCAVILAGGAGSRLRPLTDATPKPLVEFGTEPFIVGVLRRLAAAEVTDVWVLVGADTAPFGEVVAVARTFGVDVRIVNETSPLGTAGGVRQLAEHLHEPFFVLNGDILTDVDYVAVANAHGDSVATLVVSEVDDPSSYGVCQVDNGRIIGFLEKPSREECLGPALVNAGTYLVTPDLFDGFKAGELSFERDVFPAAIRRGQQLHVYVSDANWADLGTPKRFLAGHRLALDGAISWPSVAGVSETVPGVRVDATATIARTATLVPPVLIGPHTVVESGATIGPHVVLSSHVTVGENAALSDVAVQKSVRVGAYVTLRHSIVGPHVTLGEGMSATDDCVFVTDVAPGVKVPPGFRGEN